MPAPLADSSPESRTVHTWHRWTATTLFAVAVAALCLFTAVFRFLLLPSGFPNDHYLYVAGGQQIRFGEWPTRDFLDPGLPFMFVMSAAAHSLLGDTLFAEAVLVSAAFALAAALTAVGVRAMTGSRVLGIVAALVEIAIVPRTYSYPKVLMYAAGFFLLQRYIARPTTARAIALAALVGCAFFFRHDHGVNLGVAGVVAILLTPVSRDVRWRRVLVFAGVVTLLTVPYLVYVQVYSGLLTYIQRGLEFGSRELARQPLVWPSPVGDVWAAVLVYTYWGLPVVVLLLAARDHLRERGATGARAVAGDLARVVPIAVAALLVNYSLVRKELAARLPDGIVPMVFLGTWLIAYAWRGRWPWVSRPAAVLVTAVVFIAVLTVTDTEGFIRQAGLEESWQRLPEFINETSARLQAPSAQGVTPSRAANSLVPFYPYVQRCTARDDRLLLVGFIPEVAFFAHRPFAGGMMTFFKPYYGSEHDQRLVLERLAHQRVPFVIIPGVASEFREGYPLVAAHVYSRYVPFATFSTDPELTVEVLVDRAFTATRRDAETGWPCFR